MSQQTEPFFRQRGLGCAFLLLGVELMERTNSSLLRDSRLELIRIVSMLLIIAYHCLKFTLGSDYAFILEPHGVNYHVSMFILLGGSFGSYLFIILTCWFSVDKVSFKAERLLKTLWQTWTTCIVSLVIAGVLNLRSFSMVSAIKEIVTPFYSQYWFVSAYIIFILILPMLQTVLLKMDDRSIKFTCLVLLIASPLREIIGNDLLGELGRFITVFFVIGYLKRHPGNWIERHCLLGLAIYFLFIIAFIFAGDVLPGKIFGFNLNGGEGSLYVTAVRHLRFMTIVQLIGAVIAFYAFKRIELQPSRLINTLSKTAFGVYLWHYNIMFRNLIWQDIFHVDYIYRETKLYVLLLILGPVIVYCVLSLVETIRSILFDKILYKRIPWNNRIESFVNRCYEWCKLSSNNAIKKAKDDP